MRLKRAYFIASGIAAHFAVILAIVLVAKHFDLSPRQFVYRLFEKSGVESELITTFSMNDQFQQQYAPIDFVPELHSKRAILPLMSMLETKSIDVTPLFEKQHQDYKPCRFTGLYWDTACYLATHDKALEKTLINQLKSFSLRVPNASGHHGNGWELAFLYQTIKRNIDISKRDRQLINDKLNKAANHYLVLLNDTSASLWHGRASLIAQLWLTTVAIDEVEKELVARAASHLYVLIEALEMTEAWPEGYSYWINSRAHTISLALAAYLQLTSTDKWHTRISQVLSRVGLWHIYATRPDKTIEPLGDEGPRIDLKDDSRRVIDIIAQITGQSVFYDYADLIAQKHGGESYYREYRWGHTFYSDWFNESNQRDKIESLPSSELFGYPYYGLAYLRQGWDEDSTFVSYRSGGSFTHHGHYDSGHVTLFKGAPLLLNSSLYHGFTSENRLDYSIRTIAKNSIVIEAKDSPELDGGQRVTLPTGSAIFSISNWLENRNKGMKLSGGEIKSYQFEDYYSYINSDLTKSYHSQWLSSSSTNRQANSIERELFYDNHNDILVIRDRIDTAQTEQQAKLIYHTQHKPDVNQQTVYEGTLNNGIIQTTDNELKIHNGNGRLITKVFGDYSGIKLVGGNDYAFYVDGRNRADGVPNKVIESAAKWRFEIDVAKGVGVKEIYTVHLPSLKTFSERSVEIMVNERHQKWLKIDDMALLFGGLKLSGKEISEHKLMRIVSCNSTRTEMPCKMTLPER